MKIGDKVRAINLRQHDLNCGIKTFDTGVITKEYKNVFIVKFDGGKEEYPMYDTQLLLVDPSMDFEEVMNRR